MIMNVFSFFKMNKKCPDLSRLLYLLSNLFYSPIELTEQPWLPFFPLIKMPVFSIFRLLQFYSNATITVLCHTHIHLLVSSEL